jgi:hypothetical protein
MGTSSGSVRFSVGAPPRTTAPGLIRRVRDAWQRLHGARDVGGASRCAPHFFVARIHIGGTPGGWIGAHHAGATHLRFQLDDEMRGLTCRTSTSGTGSPRSRPGSHAPYVPVGRVVGSRPSARATTPAQDRRSRDSCTATVAAWRDRELPVSAPWPAARPVAVESGATRLRGGIRRGANCAAVAAALESGGIPDGWADAAAGCRQQHSATPRACFEVWLLRDGSGLGPTADRSARPRHMT